MTIRISTESVLSKMDSHNGKTNIKKAVISEKKMSLWASWQPRHKEGTHESQRSIADNLEESRFQRKSLFYLKWQNILQSPLYKGQGTQQTIFSTEKYIMMISDCYLLPTYPFTFLMYSRSCLSMLLYLLLSKCSEARKEFNLCGFYSWNP